ncbi:MAG: toll/interleukin-1 receptor domain-containing protein [Blastocatellia bacterium]
MLRNQLFISYSHRDKIWLDKLLRNLKSYIHETPMIIWDDTKISPGANWEREINQALASAKVAVLLVSYDFLASDFIRKVELPYLIEAADEEIITVIPVAVRPSAWEKIPLGAIQWANAPERPLSGLSKSEVDKELVRICGDISSHFGPEAACPSGDSAVRAEGPSGALSRSHDEGVKTPREPAHDPAFQMKGAAFESVFMTSRKHFDTLAYYKELHDLLHTLQLQCYDCLVGAIRTARRDPDDILVWADVSGAQMALRKIVEDFDKVVRRTCHARTAPLWIPKFVGDLKVLSKAIEQKDMGQIDNALKPIERILATEASQINDRLFGVLEGLAIDDLMDALDKLCSSLRGAGLNPRAVKKFEDGAQAIRELNESLGIMIKSHNTWQYIDNKLRLIQTTMIIDLAELENSWDELRSLTETQCCSCDEGWAELIRQDIVELDAALTAGIEASKIRGQFQSFRGKMKHRFYSVDFDLKDLCQKLFGVGESLATVWEVVR